MDRETAGKVRGMVRRANLKNFRDDGEMQTCSVEVADGIWRDDVEVLQPYGFAAHVPEDGALGIVLAVEGDEGNLVVLPVSNPSKRMGKLKPGEVGVYNEHGDRQILTAGGNQETAVGADVTVKAGANVSVEGGQTITLTGASGHLA